MILTLRKELEGSLSLISFGRLIQRWDNLPIEWLHQDQRCTQSFPPHHVTLPRMAGVIPVHSCLGWSSMQCYELRKYSWKYSYALGITFRIAHIERNSTTWRVKISERRLVRKVWVVVCFSMLTHSWTFSDRDNFGRWREHRAGKWREGDCSCTRSIT